MSGVGFRPVQLSKTHFEFFPDTPHPTPFPQLEINNEPLTNEKQSVSIPVCFVRGDGGGEGGDRAVDRPGS